MKKIYTIALDDDIPLSDDVLNKIKMLCFLIYDDIKNLDFESSHPILCRDGIVYNELLEKYYDHEFHYRFTYNDYKTGKYEPFMISDTSFGFTVNSEALTDNEMMVMLEHFKKMLDIDYKFTLSEYEYSDDLKHKNRLVALKRILLDMSSKRQREESKDKYARVLKPLVSSIVGVLR